MSAFIIVDFTPKDTDKMKEYSGMAGPLVKEHGGEVLVRGASESLHGETPYSSKLVLRFPDREQALNWYNSVEYQQIIPLRDEAMTSWFHLVG